GRPGPQAAPPRASEGGEPMTRTPAATVLVQIALRDFEPFHDSAGEPYVTTRDGPRETFLLRSGELRARLARTYFRELGDAVSDTAISTALTTVAGLAREEGPEDEVYLRVAGDAGRVWIDLADAERRVVEIDSGGWRNATEVPVRFLRPP